MSAADRFVLSEDGFAERWRKRPMAIAVAAALGGVAFGALAVSLANRPTPSTQEPIVAAEPGSSDRTAAVTTGVASGVVAESTARSEPATTNAKGASEQAVLGSDNPDASGENCSEQAWPYLTPCTTKAESGSRQVRVISTDKLAEPVGSVPAAPRAKIETTAPVTRAPSSPASTVRPMPPAVASAPTASMPGPVASAPSGAVAASADPAPAPHVTPTPEITAASTQSPPRREETMPGVQDATKPAKPARKRQTRPAFTDAPETSERARPQRFTRGRIVERWTEREYDAPERSIPIFGSLFENKRVVVRYGERGQEIGRRESNSAVDADEAPTARWR
jgi:hypothetical protein